MTSAAKQPHTTTPADTVQGERYDPPEYDGSDEIPIPPEGVTITLTIPPISWLYWGQCGQA